MTAATPHADHGAALEAALANVIDREAHEEGLVVEAQEREELIEAVELAREGSL